MLSRFDYSFRALWSVCNITFFQKNDADLDSIIRLAAAQIIYFEHLFSRFQKDSTLSLLNLHKIVIVEDDFMDIFLCAHKIYRMTEGYFNPLADIRSLWYIQDFESSTLFSLQDIPEDLDMEAIQIQGNQITLRPSMNLDFWAIGKGYIADRIALFLEQKGYTNFIVNLGGDIVLRGVREGNTPPNVWIISPSLVWYVASISVLNGSVSTSGSYIRNWKVEGGEYHHIKTPGSSIQNTHLWSVTIVATYGYESDALATAVFAMGFEKWLLYCATHDIDALLVTKDSTIYYTSGFDDKYNLKK